MSIPLDRLYNYLDSLCDNDIIIYRWYPHGSKKLEDLLQCNDNFKIIQTLDEWLEKVTAPILIFHDQEPLNYNLYSHNDFVTLIKSNSRMLDRSFVYKSENWINIVAKTHLRSLTMPTNFNDYILLCHSEKNSNELELYENNNFVGVYYWSHGLIARDWFRFAKYDPDLNTDLNEFKYDFLIYNRAWSGSREYRLKFVELLLDANLVPNCNVKFNPVDDGTHYKDHKFKNLSFAITRYNFEQFITLNCADSTASADYNVNDYKESSIELVLETLFDDSRLHLTEKILRPIACGKPFMLAGTPGSLAYLRDYGFKTFDGLINESYDTIQDPLKRLHMIVSELKRISVMSRKEKQELWAKLYKISAYNKKYFFSDKFHDVIVKEYKNNLKSGLEKCKNNIHGDIWKMSADPNIVEGPILKDLGNKYARGINWLKKHNNVND